MPRLDAGASFSRLGCFCVDLEAWGSSTGYGNIKRALNPLMLSKKLDVLGVLQLFYSFSAARTSNF
ncbi:MAG: hypothetical protein EBT59_12605 [Betaproteobacteria bacterium]|nr:hypothetical protein [Betaproteobacteria bacterium]NBT99934.1 hypothetical protein [Betaproteobacteria bacterium]NCX01937.1 hypothetical protein [Betaproteobacteria bacterium]NDE31326.1 hypothetical protein [Betaproteobacteria bacterium]